MSIIKEIKGRQIIDSRGNPTVEAQVTLENGISAVSSVPSGASTGAFEAVELRDGESAYMGKGVTLAVRNINERIAPELAGRDVENQFLLDSIMCELDGSKNKERLGANAILAVSVAAAKAGARAQGVELFRYLGGISGTVMPVPMMNILNGGAHASNNVDIQEFMIMPVAAASFAEGLRWCCEVYHTLGKLLSEGGKSATVGDEGGFAPDLSSDEEAIELICTAINRAGYSTEQIKLSLDIASSEWFSDGKYMLPKRGVTMSTEEMIDFITELSGKYPIISIEDALSEYDWEGFKALTGKIGSEIQLVGDDLFVTNTERLKKGIEMGAANSILIKMNQIGTVSETLSAIRMAKNAGYTCVVSHRSGETEDTAIADLAVGLNCGQIKTGAPCRSDRVAKYNRLLRIEEMLGVIA